MSCACDGLFGVDPSEMEPVSVGESMAVFVSVGVSQVVTKAAERDGRLLELVSAFVEHLARTTAHDVVLF